MSTLTPLPSGFTSTRDALRTLACYVIAPARKARTGRIGLRPTGDGFGTPMFDDGTRIAVSGDRLLVETGRSTQITTLRMAAAFVGVELADDPGVGHDIPPFAPDQHLAVDASASVALGAWYEFGQRQLDRLTDTVEVSEAELWPEHFDLAVTVTFHGGVAANVGFSPGDGYETAPYIYVGPHDRSGLVGGYWNAPFGAVLSHHELIRKGDPDREASAFVHEGIRLLRSGIDA